jgi:hypothetical protein
LAMVFVSTTVFYIGYSLPTDSHPFGVSNSSLIVMTFNLIQTRIKLPIPFIFFQLVSIENSLIS